MCVSLSPKMGSSRSNACANESNFLRYHDGRMMNGVLVILMNKDSPQWVKHLWNSMEMSICTCRSRVPCDCVVCFAALQWVCIHTSHYAKKPHKATTMLSTSKNVLVSGHNHLLTTDTDDPTLWLSPEPQPVKVRQYRWLWPRNITLLEVASMVVTWWTVAFLCSVSSWFEDWGLICKPSCYAYSWWHRICKLRSLIKVSRRLSYHCHTLEVHYRNVRWGNSKKLPVNFIVWRGHR